MALNSKALGLIAVLGGGGIAIPIYLNNVSVKGTAVNAQMQEPVRLPSVTSSRSTRSTESIEKVSCSVANSSSSPKDMADFVSKKGNKVDLYSFLSCANLTLKVGEDSYFGKKWDGLFPTKVLDEKLSYKGGTKFEIKATIDKEEDNLGNGIPVITLSNPNGKNFIKGKWGFEETSFKKKAITVSIEGIRQMPNKVYLFIDAPDQKIIEQT